MEMKQSSEKGVFIKDLLIQQTKSSDQMEALMEKGFNNRAVAQTAMNATSSRSHSIFTIYVQTAVTDDRGGQNFRVGKLNLVDLAGSQRQSKTQAAGDRLKQATKINLSLSALGNVISALVDGKKTHIPYRDSKLTRLLQDSLGGNTKTIMIAALSPADYNYDQSLSTLRYASSAKFIQNKPKINEDPKDAMLRQYADEIKRLKDMLQGKIPINAQSIVSKSSASQDNSQTLKQKQKQLTNQKEEKQRLQKQLKALQQALQNPHSDEKNISQQQKEKYRQMKDKLKAQKKRQEQLRQKAKKKEKELLHIEQNYKSLSEQVEVMRRRFQQVKKKYIESLQELKDIQIEHQNDKEELLDTIRFQQRQIKFFSKIVEIILPHSQIDKIRNISDWDDIKKDYNVPPFVLRDKKVNLPKLKNSELMDLIEQQKGRKQIIKIQEEFKKSSFFQRSSQQIINLRKGITDIQKAKERLDRIDRVDMRSSFAKQYTVRSKFNAPYSVEKVEKKQYNVHLTPLDSQGRYAASTNGNVPQDRLTRRQSKLDPIIAKCIKDADKTAIRK